jgi:hypothetical protein
MPLYVKIIAVVIGAKTLIGAGWLFGSLIRDAFRGGAEVLTLTLPQLEAVVLASVVYGMIAGAWAMAVWKRQN